jgi:thioester reductase-like protein
VVAVSVFLTGFPGFLGSALVERLLDRTGEIDCLIQSRYREAAERRAREISGENWRDRIELHEGDITEPDLGLEASASAAIQERTETAFHFAAVYDLGVARDVAEAVNVAGTEHVLEFVQDCATPRLHYVSTCYVSGRYDGVFGEDDLDVGQQFNNHYEATKFEAEKRVQERMHRIETTIYRPAIVVGDSTTGETEKYDGPYGILRLLLRQPGHAVLPRMAGASNREVNLVPQDFVIDAIEHLSSLDDSAGQVYQLCDPHPPTVAKTMALFADATDRRVHAIPLPQSLVEGVLQWVPGAETLTGVDPDTVPYFTHPTRYVCPNTRRDLAGTDIECPPLSSYVDTLVSYLQANPDLRTGAMQ